MSQDGWKLLLHPGDARGPALLPASASPVRPSVCPPAVLLAEEVLYRLLLPACTPSLVGCPPATLTPSIHLDPMVIASPAQQGSQRLLPSLLRPSSSNCVCVHTCTRVYVYVCVCVCVCVCLAGSQYQEIVRVLAALSETEEPEYTFQSQYYTLSTITPLLPGTPLLPSPLSSALTVPWPVCMLGHLGRVRLRVTPSL